MPTKNSPAGLLNAVSIDLVAIPRNSRTGLAFCPVTEDK
jgi:hypothetical protein